MNKQYINSELKKRGISVTFFWQGNAGPALRFYTGKSGNEAYWNALLPIDDESDAAFVDFVEANYKRLLTPRALDAAVCTCKTPLIAPVNNKCAVCGLPAPHRQ